ncbi:MAG: hypothetical protein J0L64_16120 [Acidobacteria bacterium]|nr:hypothetical protein [Acidobacteriota bacterium]
MKGSVRTRKLLLLAGLTVVALAGCSHVATTVGGLREVHAAVSRMGLAEEVAIHLMNGERLNVRLVNPKQEQASEAERKGQAFVVARQAFERYGPKEKLTGVTVSYTQRKRYLLLLNWEESRTYEFGVGELKAPAAVGEARPPGVREK